MLYNPAERVADFCCESGVGLVGVVQQHDVAKALRLCAEDLQLVRIDALRAGEEEVLKAPGGADGGGGGEGGRAKERERG